MATKYRLALLMQCINLVVIHPALAQQVLFNFDDAPIHTSLPITLTAGGITAHFSATGQGFSIQEANTLGFTPAGFSGLVIYPNSIYLADLLIKFDTTISDFSIMYACQELGCDDAATMRVTAYYKGNLVGSNTKTAANPGTWPVDVLSCSFTQVFDSVVMHYDKRPPTCQDYGVIFLADNMQVTAKSVLSVNLLYFTCEASGSGAVLHWRSAGEINFSSYIVQYANNSNDFKDIAIINAGTPGNNYSYSHHNVSGIAYYRLKMVNRDGTFKYSGVKKLILGSKTRLTIYPNPAKNYIIIDGDAVDVKAVQVFSAEGGIVKVIKQYTARQKIMINDLPAGAYLLKAFSAEDKLLFEKLFLKM